MLIPVESPAVESFVSPEFRPIPWARQRSRRAGVEEGNAGRRYRRRSDLDRRRGARVAARQRMSPRSHGPSAGPTKPSALAGRFIAFSVSFCGPGLPHCSCIATSPNSVAQILKEIKFFFFLIKKKSFTYTRFFTFPSNSGLQLHFIRQVKVSHLRGFNKKKCKCSLTIISCAFYSRQRHV